MWGRCCWENATISKSADGTKPDSIVKYEDDSDRLQEDINMQVEWAGAWQMKFNEEKS